MKRLLIALCLALFVAPISHAAEASHLELIGFSKNGAFMAFTQFGVQDGSGFPFIFTSFVTVKSNRLEVRVGVVIENASATVTQARATIKVGFAAAMKKYGIIAGNQGRFIGITPQQHMYIPSSEFFALDRTYGLNIATKPAVNPGEVCDPSPELLIVELTVSGKTRDLQRDARLPASRECAFGYEMRSAHLYGRSLAVFVSYLTPGFEGSNVSWMVVTGML